MDLESWNLGISQEFQDSRAAQTLHVHWQIQCFDSFADVDALVEVYHWKIVLNECKSALSGSPVLYFKWCMLPLVLFMSVCCQSQMAKTPLQGKQSKPICIGVKLVQKRKGKTTNNCNLPKQQFNSLNFKPNSQIATQTKSSTDVWTRCEELALTEERIPLTALELRAYLAAWAAAADCGELEVVVIIIWTTVEDKEHILYIYNYIILKFLVLYQKGSLMCYVWHVGCFSSVLCSLSLLSVIFFCVAKGWPANLWGCSARGGD